MESIVYIFYRITCPDCRQQIRSVVEAFVSFNAEDAENFALKTFQRNAAQQNVPNVEQPASPDQSAHAPTDLAIAPAHQPEPEPEPAPEQNHGWLVEDNFDHEDENENS